MKKLISLLLIALMAMSLVACGGKEDKLDAPLTDIMQAIVTDAVPADQLPMSLTEIEVTSDLAESFLGTSDIDYKEALAMEPMMSSVAFSVVLVRMNDEADVEDAMTKISSTINPRKWICVEAENVIVESRGDVILVVMANEPAELIATAFNEYK